MNGCTDNWPTGMPTSQDDEDEDDRRSVASTASNLSGLSDFSNFSGKDWKPCAGKSYLASLPCKLSFQVLSFSAKFSLFQSREGEANPTMASIGPNMPRFCRYFSELLFWQFIKFKLHSPGSVLQSLWPLHLLSGKLQSRIQVKIELGLVSCVIINSRKVCKHGLARIYIVELLSEGAEATVIT